MTEPVITGVAVGLKCDAPDCGWSDMSIKRSEYEALRNAPCPDCGANILTDADYASLLAIEKTMAFLNDNQHLLDGIGAAPGEGILHSINFSTDGTGAITITHEGAI